jgi:hypothetical protein
MWMSLNHLMVFWYDAVNWMALSCPCWIWCPHVLGVPLSESFWRQFAISCHCIVHMYETQMQSLKRCKMCHQNAQLSAILCIDWHILKAGNWCALEDEKFSPARICPFGRDDLLGQTLGEYNFHVIFIFFLYVLRGCKTLWSFLHL